MLRHQGGDAVTVTLQDAPAVSAAGVPAPGSISPSRGAEACRLQLHTPGPTIGSGDEPVCHRRVDMSRLDHLARAWAAMPAMVRQGIQIVKRRRPPEHAAGRAAGPRQAAPLKAGSSCFEDGPPPDTGSTLDARAGPRQGRSAIDRLKTAVRHHSALPADLAACAPRRCGRRLPLAILKPWHGRWGWRIRPFTHGEESAWLGTPQLHGADRPHSFSCCPGGRNSSRVPMAPELAGARRQGSSSPHPQGVVPARRTGSPPARPIPVHPPLCTREGPGGGAGQLRVRLHTSRCIRPPSELVTTAPAIRGAYRVADTGS